MQKPKLIFHNDGRHYNLYRFDPPMSLHQFRQPVDEILGTGVDTLSFGLGSGQTFWHDTKVGIRWGERITPPYQRSHVVARGGEREACFGGRHRPAEGRGRPCP